MHQASCRRRSSSTRSGGSISASAYARIVSSNVKRGSEPRASVEETSPASRSASRPAATSVDGSAAASSAPSVAPAGNAASTASTCGAGGPSSRTLQSIAARSERWRSGRSGALRVRNARASPSREAVPSTPRTRTRAAASSIARGSPSRARRDPRDGGRVLRRELELRHRFPRPVDVEPDRRARRRSSRGRPPRRPAPRAAAPGTRARAPRGAGRGWSRARGAAGRRRAAPRSTRTTPGGARGCPARATAAPSRAAGRSPRPAARPRAPRPRASLRSSGARAPGRSPARGRRTARRRASPPRPARASSCRCRRGPVSVTSRVSSRPRSAVDRRELAARPIEHRLGHGARRRLGHARRGEGRIVLEDPALEGAELRRRLEPELVERRARVAVGVERVGLPAGAVEGEHQLAAEPLTMRMCGDERLELAGERRRAARVEIQVDPSPRGRRAALRRAAPPPRPRTARTRRPRAPARARARAPLGAPPDRPARAARTARRRARRARPGRGSRAPA